MVLFFYGPNTFLINEKLRELSAKYKKAAGGDLNYVRAAASDLTYDEYARQVLAVPLLCSSRLIVIESPFSAPKELQDKIKDSLNLIPPTTNLVFVELGEPDRRLGLLHALKKEKNQYFGELVGAQVIKFIKSQALIKGATISNGAAQVLCDYTLGDLWKIDNELEKLANYTRGEISVSDVETITTRGVSANAFAFVDSLAANNLKRALENLNNLLAAGEPPLKILGLINYQFRSIACVKAALETIKGRGFSRPTSGGAQDDKGRRFQIAKMSSLSPFQVNKFYSLAEKLSWQELLGVYSRLVLVDEKIKTGKIEGSEGLKELVLSIDAGR